MNKQTFSIPEGCKAITIEIIDNKIVTTFEIEPIKWRAERGEQYFCITPIATISTSPEQGLRVDGEYYKFGNYFQTKEQAQRAADKLKSALDEFWKEELK